MASSENKEELRSPEGPSWRWNVSVPSSHGYWPADHGQNVQLHRAHAFQGQIQGLVGMQMRKIQESHLVAEFAIRPLRQERPNLFFHSQLPLRMISEQIVEIGFCRD
jgi:hypothetical protein